MNGKVLFVNPEQLGRIFALNMKAGIPTNVVGDVGTGKTSAADDFHRALNEIASENGSAPWRKWKLFLGMIDPTDLGGFPSPQTADEAGPEKMVEFLMASHMDFFHPQAKGIVIADEVDRAKGDTQSAFMHYLLGREIHGHKIGDNVYFIMTMNGTADIFTTPLCKAARTRICTVYVGTNAEKSMESYDKWADENDINPIVRGFARFKPELCKGHEDYEELAIYTPRTRDMAGEVLKAAEEVNFQTDDILLPVLAGIVGKAAALELIAYKELFEKCPSPEEILADPENAPMPEENGILYAVGLSLIGQVGPKDRKTAEKVVTYAVRMPKELTAFVLKRLGEKCPNTVTCEAFLNWAEQNKLILI